MHPFKIMYRLCAVILPFHGLKFPLIFTAKADLFFECSHEVGYFKWEPMAA